MLKPVIVGVLLLGAGSAMAQTLRIGLEDDIGTLDPHRSLQMVDRMVFASMCDSLITIDQNLKLVPRLATSWSVSPDGKTVTLFLRRNVTFQDGEPLNAAAVKANFDRELNSPVSTRKVELASVDTVRVVDDSTVQLVLKYPDSALLSMLSDRAGMMLAPKTLSSDDGIARHPVCVGPYQFSQSVQNYRVVLDKSPTYWDAAAYPIKQVVFMPIPDATVRLANLRSGAIDIAERIAPSDVASVERDTNLRFVLSQGLGFMSMTYNLNNGPSSKGPWRDGRVREALNLTLDRNAINQVIGNGIFKPAVEAIPPTSPYFDSALSAPARDVNRARALLAAAGYPNGVDIQLMLGNDTITMQLGQIIQAMASEAGIRLKLVPTDFAAEQGAAIGGNFQMILRGWSGRVDPDGNLGQFVSCKGAMNYGRFCDPQVDALLTQARGIAAVPARKQVYAQLLQRVADQQPITYLYYPALPFALSSKVNGFVAYPDGLIRLRGMTLKP
ncbi:MAG TPA: ABC transporter substrate-binding protein [Paraburkholderia sp.]|jgi:peptide/nickel transport system substrate-binding protein|nr:ABC transporter substrate-binding protein [Paraburkholderia sp.]